MIILASTLATPPRIEWGGAQYADGEEVVLGGLSGV
jgi:hypothetical protein